VGSAGRLYVRLFAWRSGDRGDIPDPDVLVLKPSEIASVSTRTVEVFLYGPKPKPVEWLVIRPVQTVAEDISSHIRPLLTPKDQDKAVLVAHEDGRLTVEWRWWRPDLETFLQQVARECPSALIAPEERSELDLNGIWNGIREKPNAQERLMLAQAARLGFGCRCVELLSLHRAMSFREAGTYLAEIEREEFEKEVPGGPPGSSGCRLCR
jgi:hypothetical protein